MPDPIAKAFLSYAHADNDREGGRLLRLAELIKNEFALLTGSEIEIFTDDSGIRWGDDWREKIEESLQETTFFIPVLTPTYFVREECRREMTRFTTTAATLGLRKLLLSIRYIPVPDLHEASVDDLKSRAAKMQFESWDDLRLKAEDAPEHRQAIHRLASRLVQLTQELEGGHGGSGAQAGSAALVAPDRPAGGVSSQAREESEVQQPQGAADDDEDEDEDGPIDVLADAGPALEDWGTTLQQFPVVTERFNAKFNAASEQMSAANQLPNSFAIKVQVARQLAADIEPELSEIEDLSKSYSERLTRVDAVLRAMYDLAQMSTDPEVPGQVQTLDTMVENLIASSLQAKIGLTNAADAARSNAKLSKDLRPVLRRFETALRNIIDGSTLIESWSELGGAERRLVT